MVEVEQELPKLSVEGKLRVQQVVGTLLFYSKQVDSTMLISLSSIPAEQNNGMASTAQAVAMLLDYAATNPDAKIRFRCSDMILCIHSDASYLSEKKAQIRVAGYFYFGEEKVDKINGPVLVLAKILNVLWPLQQKQNVVASMRIVKFTADSLLIGSDRG
eukprot:15041415-Ditylum_brightwellii.AAC.1